MNTDHQNRRIGACNLCGGLISKYSNDYILHQTIGYGSTFDGETVDLHLCSKCLDRLIAACEITPLVGYEEGSDE